ncbi:hypothetical protein AB5J62_24175 [Amycolatopsis sp. cg5]|uniref:hypothetical protein n=1 Tax=Amycolatopsis sp. cg5 TaxID=3238802 RepID=UPI0035254E5C
MRNKDGNLVALFVRYPDDTPDYQAAVKWAENATADRLRTYSSLVGSTAVVENSPWPAGMVPAFVLGGVGVDGYQGIRRDGAVQQLTPAVLGRVLRNEPDLRSMLGRGNVWGRPLALVALNGGAEGPAEFSRSLLAGGISRFVHHQSGRVVLSEDGAIGIGGRFATVRAPLPEPEHVVTYAKANEILGTHGQFFPLDEFDAHAMFLGGGQDSFLQQQYYYRTLGNGSSVARHVPFVSPWAGIRRLWSAAGHGSEHGLVFGLKTDQPLHIGDSAYLTSGAARIVAGSDVYRLASPAPDTAILLDYCSSMVRPSGGTATPAEIFQQEWRQIIGPARVFGGTRSVRVNSQNAVRSVRDDGRFVEVLPEGGPLPEVKLADLAPTAIPSERVRFVGSSRTLGGQQVEDVRRLAGLLGAAAAWAGRHGAGFPRVTIRGRGRVETSVGRQRAAAVAAVLYEGLVAAAAQLRRLGLSFEPDSIAVGYAGVVAGIAEIEVTLPQQDLGQTTLARAAVDDPGPRVDPSPRVVDQVNAAFAQLAPGSTAIPALPSADGSTAGITLGQPPGMANGDVAGSRLDAGVMVPSGTEHASPSAVDDDGTPEMSRETGADLGIVVEHPPTENMASSVAFDTGASGGRSAKRPRREEAVTEAGSHPSEVLGGHDSASDGSEGTGRPLAKRARFTRPTTVFAAAPQGLGAVAFSVDPVELAEWHEVYEQLPEQPIDGSRNPFYVFVTARGGVFVVDGRAVTGTELARQVARTGEYRAAVAAEPDMPVSVVLSTVGPMVEPTGALHEFSDALRGRGPYQEMHVADLPVAQQPQFGGFHRISSPRLADVEWKRLRDAHGREYGLMFPPSAAAGQQFVRGAFAATDHTQRVLGIRPEESKSGTDSSSDESENRYDGKAERIAAWAGATEEGRAHPLHLILTGTDGVLTVRFKHGQVLEVSDEEMAGLIMETDIFARASDAVVRRPLIVVTSDWSGIPEVAGLDRGLLSVLKRRTGPWQTFSFAGAVTVDPHAGFLSLPSDGVFSESPLKLSDVQYVRYGPVFGFPSGRARGGVADGLRQFADAIAAGTADTRGEWGDREPIFVYADGAVKHVKVELRNRIVAEVEGHGLGKQLLSDPEFVRALGDGRDRPVVLVSSFGAERVNFGGLGFDFAGALRAAGHFVDVYAPTGVAGFGPDGVVRGTDSVFDVVSVWRAGDIRMTTLSSDDGTVTINVLRSPDDRPLLRQVRRWLEGAGRDSLLSFTDSRGSLREVPWTETPLLVVATLAPDGAYSVLRSDDAGDMLSTEALGQVLRDDRVLRDQLGNEPDGPILVIGVGGETPPLGEFAAAMLTGGYSRTMFRPLGVVSFADSGALVVEGFEKLDALQPLPTAYLSYPQVTAKGVLHGQFYPSEAFDAVEFALDGIHYVDKRQRTYFREVRNAKTLATREEVSSPWKDESPWLVDGHSADPAGLAFAMATGRPHERGDVLSLVGEHAARAIFACEVFVRAGVAPNRPLLLGHCASNATDAGRRVSVALLIKQAWERDFRPVKMYGADTDLWTNGRGRRTLDVGGSFTEIGNGTTPRPGTPTGTDGIGVSRPSDTGRVEHSVEPGQNATASETSPVAEEPRSMIVRPEDEGPRDAGPGR